MSSFSQASGGGEERAEMVSVPRYTHDMYTRGSRWKSELTKITPDGMNRTMER